jgi:hypothetical protein
LNIVGWNRHLLQRAQREIKTVCLLEGTRKSTEPQLPNQAARTRTGFGSRASTGSSAQAATNLSRRAQQAEEKSRSDPRINGQVEKNETADARTKKLVADE